VERSGEGLVARHYLQATPQVRRLGPRNVGLNRSGYTTLSNYDLFVKPTVTLFVQSPDSTGYGPAVGDGILFLTPVQHQHPISGMGWVFWLCWLYVQVKRSLERDLLIIFSSALKSN